MTGAQPSHPTRPCDLTGLPRLPNPSESGTPDSPRSGVESPRTPKSGDSSRAKEMLARMVNNRLHGRMPGDPDGPTSPRALQRALSGDSFDMSGAKVSV